MTRSFFRSLSIAACLLAVTANINLFGQGRSRGSAPAAPGAKSAPTPGAAKSSTLAITTASLPDAEATRDYSAQIEVKGGRAPLTFTSDNSDVSIGDGKVTFTPDTAGTVNFKITVTDADNRKVEKQFTVRVGTKKMTNDEIIAAARQDLLTQSDLATALASKADKVALAITDTNVGAVQAVTINFASRLKSLETIVTYVKYGLIVLLAIAFAIFIVRRFRTRNAGPVASAIALLIFASAASAATPKLICGDPTYNANFFPSDGKEYEVRCVGIKGSKVEIGSVDASGTFTADSAITITDPKATANGITFKMTAASAATLGYPAMQIDGKTVESSLEIVNDVTFTERDRAITSLRQVGGGSGSSSNREDMRWLALFNGVCGTETGKGRCGREFGSPVTGLELFKQLKAAKNQAEEDVVMRQLAHAAEFNATDRVFSDPRLEAAIVGGVKAGLATIPPATTVDLAPLKAEIAVVRTTADGARDAAELAGRKLEGTRQIAEATADAVSSVRGARPILGGGGLSKNSRKLLEERLRCARTLAITGQVAEGCPEPAQQ